MEYLSGARRSIFRLLIAIAMGLAWPAIAKDALPVTYPYIWDRYDQYDLPQRSINAIVQTRDGYLWLGTNSGLLRFDGNVMAPEGQAPEDADSSGLPSNRITALHEDEQGRLWIGTENAGVLFRHQGRLVHLDVCGKRCQVNSIVGDAKGRIWVASSKTIYMLKGRSIQTTWTPPSRNGWIGAMEMGPEGTPYVRWEGGVGALVEGKLVPVPLPAGVERITSLAVTTGHVWITSSQGLFAYATSTRSWKRLTDNGGATIRSFSGDAGRLLASLPEGVFFVDERSLAMTRAVDVPGLEILSVARDDEGNHWIGTSQDGLWRLSESGIGLLQDAANGFDPPGKAVVEDAAGGFWFGLRCRGLRSVEPGRIWAEPQPICVNGLLADGDRLWVTTDEEKIYRVEAHRMTLAAHWTDAYPLRLWRSADGAYWVVKGMNLHALHVAEDGKPTLGPAVQAVAGLNIAKLRDAADGGIWLMTDRGVLRLQAGRIVERLAEDDRVAVLARDIVEDRDGTRWIATYYGAGLLRVGPQGTEVIDESKGLRDTALSCLFLDRADNLWAIGNRGVSVLLRGRAEAGEYTWVYFDESDGLRPAEVNGGLQSACLQDTAGRIWISLIRGFAVLDPERLLMKERKRLRTYIDTVRVEGEVRGIHMPLLLDTDDRSVEVDFTAINYSHPDRVEFRYRVNADQDGWIEVGSSRKLVLAEVAWGTTLLEVQSRVAGGRWSLPAHLIIEKKRPWFNHPALWAAFVAACLALLIWPTRDRPALLARPPQ